ncbi:hypothetical protein J0S82_020072 [Galemys pyrenaicus]|uniref:Uncharacterized protein n=1 Tax=Galemys pyrenaicus TaxID=202257 RepID=A0A8J5ZSE1_GALPY|nr:hypothetical protein J0S82_020072 [Galemys pyrenaicus]
MRKRRSRYHPPSGDPRHCDIQSNLNILGRAPSGETSLTTAPSSIKFLDSAMKTEGNNTLMSMMDVKSSKDQIKTGCEEAL